MKTYWLSKKPPTVWSMYVGMGRRRKKSPKYKSWIADAMSEMLEQGIKRFDGDYYLEIYIPIKYRRSNADIDNMIKPVVDMLVTSGVTPDDRYLYGVTIRYFHELRVCIDVKPMPTEPI